jgi:light-regulated signal transduction histidine kinase (bacteriophytochrome)
MNEASRKLAITAAQLAAYVEPFREHMVGIAGQARTTAVEYVFKRTSEISAESQRMQTQAMNEAARAIIDREVGPPLRRLASNLAQLVQQQRRSWETWAAHAATATVAATLAAMLVFNIVHRSPSPAQTVGVSPASGAASDSGIDPVRQEQRTPEGDAGHSAAASSTRRLKGK